MKPLLLPKGYRELLDEKKQVEKELRWFLVKKMFLTSSFNALKDISKLGLRGGPKDLSSKLDHYLQKFQN